MNALDKAYIWASIGLSRAKDRVKEFWAEEAGVSNVVATIIILLIVVLIIGVFWTRLQSWLQTMLDNIFDTDFNNTELH